jgi:hypothetical protein
MKVGVGGIGGVGIGGGGVSVNREPRDSGGVFPIN